MSRKHPENDLVKKPYYPGGNKELKAFISKNLRYPKEALEKRIEGTVALRYEINYKGKVTKVKIISGLGYGCDEEAERLVRSLEFKVEKNRKLKLKFHKNIQIHFKLPPAFSPAAKLNYTYQNTTESKKEEKKSTSYNYTIRF